MSGFRARFDRALERKYTIAEHEADSKRIAALRSGGGGGAPQGLAAGQSFDEGPYGHKAMNAAQQARHAEGLAKQGQPQGGQQFTPLQGLRSSPQLDMFKTSSVTSPSFSQMSQAPSLGDSKSYGLTNSMPLGTPSGFSPNAPVTNYSQDAGSRSFEDETQQFNFGTEEVVDPTGNGSPTQDTVHAKLAEGEAIINAAAMDVPGRKELVAKWNKEGAKKMGLRGGPQMKAGVLHAATGAPAYKSPEWYAQMQKHAAGQQQFAPNPPQAAPHSTARSAGAATGKFIRGQGGVTPIVGKALGGGLAVGSAHAIASSHDDFYQDDAVPTWEKAKQAARDFGQVALPTAGAIIGSGVTPFAGTAVGLGLGLGATRAFDEEGAALQAWKKANPKAGPTTTGQVSSSKQAPIQPAFVEATPPQVDPQAQRTLRDNAGFSEFFNKAGITDAQREAAPAYASGQYGGVPMSDAQVMGLRPGSQNDGPLGRLKLDNSTDQIYRQGNTYTGMGAPSRVNAEIAQANDPAVKKEAMMTSLRNAAMRGDKQAADMYNQHVQADSYANTAAQGVEQERVKAGKAGKSGGADSPEYKIIKDIVEQEQFTRENEDGETVVDLKAKAEFNDFWPTYIAKAKKYAAENGDTLEFNDAADAQAFMAAAKSQFQIAREVNKKGKLKFDRPLHAARKVDNLTLADAKGFFSRGDGGHSMMDAMWDNVPFAAEGGLQFQDEYGTTQTIPSHSGGNFDSMTAEQRQGMRELFKRKWIEQQGAAQ